MLYRGSVLQRARDGRSRRRLMRGDDDDIDAAVEAASVFGGVVGHGVVLGITGGGETPGVDVLAGNEDADDFGGAGGGELPVGVEVNGVNRNVVGVALDAEIAADRGDNRAEAVEGIERAGAQIGRSAIEKTDLVEAEDEAFRSLAERDGVFLKFGGKIGLQLAEDDIGGGLRAGGMGEGGRALFRESRPEQRPVRRRRRGPGSRRRWRWRGWPSWPCRLRRRNRGRQRMRREGS